MLNNNSTCNSDVCFLMSLSRSGSSWNQVTDFHQSNFLFYFLSCVCINMKSYHGALCNYLCLCIDFHLAFCESFWSLKVCLNISDILHKQQLDDQMNADVTAVQIISEQREPKQTAGRSWICAAASQVSWNEWILTESVCLSADR